MCNHFRYSFVGFFSSFWTLSTYDVSWYFPAVFLVQSFLSVNRRKRIKERDDHLLDSAQWTQHAMVKKGFELHYFSSPRKSEQWTLQKKVGKKRFLLEAYNFYQSTKVLSLNDITSIHEEVHRVWDRNLIHKVRSDLWNFLRIAKKKKNFPWNPKEVVNCNKYSKYFTLMTPKYVRNMKFQFNQCKNNFLRITWKSGLKASQEIPNKKKNET